MASVEGPVAEFSGFANLLMSFLKIVYQMGSFGGKRKTLFFHFCRPILDFRISADGRNVNLMRVEMHSLTLSLVENVYPLHQHGFGNAVNPVSFG